ncbi:hypothetical protein H9P43_001923 [Blastocladiella emersonii ATCC 22665]|nr:hypothetical protein H9P43_001923 [Blastocladiella emersonii ATCC 22665]
MYPQPARLSLLATLLAIAVLAAPAADASVLTKRGIAVPASADHHVVSVRAVHPRTGLALATLQKRDAATGRDQYRDKLVVQVSGGPEPIALDLELNRELLGPQYQHILGDAPSTTPPPDNCFYRGTVQGRAGSLVAVSACEGDLHGLVQVDPTTRYSIHALSSDGDTTAGTTRSAAGLSKRHVLVRDTGRSATGDPEEPRVGHCPQSDPSFHSPRGDSHFDRRHLVPASSLHHADPPASSFVHRAAPLVALIKREYAARNNKTIELMLANDYQRYQAFGNDTELTALELVNVANVLLTNATGILAAPYKIAVTVAGQYTATSPKWVTGSPSTVDVGTLLQEFCQWRQSQLTAVANVGNFLQLNDAGHLLTNRTLVSSGVSAAIDGYSYVGGMCKASSACGVDYAPRTINPAYQGTVLAHELGHNLGSGHDGSNNACPSTGFIMQPAACSNCAQLATTFSNCSKSAIESFFNSADTTCLDNSPTLCGNGIVDPGEQCDSGDRVNGSACCTRSCTLRSNAACDDKNGACCKNCQLLAKDTVCRARTNDAVRSSCDIADVCTGTSPACPDLSAANGATCFADVPKNSSKGFCNNGWCTSRANACAAYGYPYSSGCDKPAGAQACTLFCAGQDGNGCVSFQYNAAGTSVIAPDFGPCPLDGGKSGYCLAGTCVAGSQGQNVNSTSPNAGGSLVFGGGSEAARWMAMAMAAVPLVLAAWL